LTPWRFCPGPGKGTTLYIRGRDVEEQEKAIRFSKTSCRWTILGDAEEVHRTESRAAIVTVLNDLTKVSQPLGPKEIADLCDMREDLVRQTLGRMVGDAEIIRVSHGHYISADRQDLEQMYRRHNITSHKSRKGDKVTK
jgi:hypothetical protein